MKTLLLLRHAKSSWGVTGQKDFDRPLKEKGREGAALIGAHLHAIGSLPDVIISSPALRARQTTECVVGAIDGAGSGAGAPPPVVSFEARLYEAPVETLLQVARSVGDDSAVVMLVGHNPSMHMAALQFSRASDSGLLSDFPTTGLARFTFDEARWRDISWSGATLAGFVFPKMLRGDAERL